MSSKQNRFLVLASLSGGTNRSADVVDGSSVLLTNPQIQRPRSTPACKRVEKIHYFGVGFWRDVASLERQVRRVDGDQIVATDLGTCIRGGCCYVGSEEKERWNQ